MSDRARRRARTGALVAAMLVIPGGCASPGHLGGVPPAAPDFVGLQTPSLLVAPRAARAHVMDLVKLSGARRLRVVVPWGSVQPHPDRYDFASLDGVIGTAARRGLEVVPMVDGAPDWAAAGRRPSRPDVIRPPRDPQTLGSFLSRLVDRYGSRGAFWATHPDIPRLPVTAWQVWNEPNLPQYWDGHPDAAAYARLLRVVGRAIHRADAHARVVSAGIPNSRLGVPFAAWVRRFLRAGGRGTFDVFGLHGYGSSAASVVAAAERARALLRANGAGHAPISMTEFGWADRGPPSPFTTTSTDQAADIGAAIRLLAARRRALGIADVFYFQLSDAARVGYPGLDWGAYTGLLTNDGRPKPAWGAFRAAVRSIARRRA